MKRETRINLWFLIVFVVISAPGAVILFRKKMVPGAPRLDEPDPVLTRLPYMTPLPAPPGMKWMIPSKTFAWLKKVAMQETGSDKLVSSLPPGPEWEPAISNDHVFQAMTMTERGHSMRFGVLLWSEGVPADKKAYRGWIGLTQNDPEFRTVITEFNRISIPEEVRKELVGQGFSRPPKEVIWLTIVPTTDWVWKPTMVGVEYSGPNGPVRSFAHLAFPTEAEPSTRQIP